MILFCFFFSFLNYNQIILGVEFTGLGFSRFIE